MDFLHHKFLPCFSKILLNHFLPFRISLSTNFLLSCLSNILLKLFYSPSILEKLSFLPSKNFFKTKKDKKDKKMKQSRRNLQKDVLRRKSRTSSKMNQPLLFLYFYYFPSFTLDISKSFVIKS